MDNTSTCKPWLLFVLCIFFSALSVHSLPVWADENLDDILSGFDESARITDIKTDKKLPQWVEIFGSLTMGTSWNFAQKSPDPGEPDYRGISMARTTAALGADFNFNPWQARISGHGFYDAAWHYNDRDLYTNRFLNSMEHEFEFDEFYISGSLSNHLDIKIGRQVVVWGKADNVRVTDVLNPMDNRTLGMVDIKYRRLPVTMGKLDYYSGSWNLSTILIQEVRFDKNPIFNSEFYPGTLPGPKEKTPASFSHNIRQYGIALNGIFSGWDISFYRARIYDRRAHATTYNNMTILEHNRVSMTGMTGNIAWGNLLFKGEGAFWQGLEFGAAPGRDFNRIDLMAGLEYTGFSETMVSLEVVNRHMNNFDHRLTLAPDFARKNILQTVLMMTKDFANDTVQLKILCSIFGPRGDGGAFERAQLEYNLSDHTTLTLGFALYHTGDLPTFTTIGRNDRIFFEYKFAF